MRNLASRRIDPGLDAEKPLAVGAKRPELWFDPFSLAISSVTDPLQKLVIRNKSPTGGILRNTSCSMSGRQRCPIVIQQSARRMHA